MQRTFQTAQCYTVTVNPAIKNHLDTDGSRVPLPWVRFESKYAGDSGATASG